MKVVERSILVTGASSGIREATARELSRQGATVVVTARRVEDLDRIALEMKQAGAMYLRCQRMYGAVRVFIAL